jgi:hypothetical protein
MSLEGSQCAFLGEPHHEDDAPPAAEELIQRRRVDDGHMGDRFELGIERGDVGGGQGRKLLHR